MSDTSASPLPPFTGEPVELAIVLDPCVNFALQQNAVSPLKELRLTNVSTVEFADLVVRVRAEPEFLLPFEHRVGHLAAGATHVCGALAPVLSPAFLAGLHERVDGLLRFEVQAAAAVVGRAERRISVLAYDQWGGLRVLPELLSAFVLPNHPAVAGWLRETAAVLERWSGDPSLSGYQSRSRDRVARTAAAVYHAMQSAGITYIDPPASFEREGQKIRTPDRISAERMGTCLDLAVLAAACLEQGGLNPLLIAVDGHAFVGVWLDEGMFTDSVVEDAALIAKRVDLGEILVFDPTLCANRPPPAFERSVAAARDRLRRPDEFRAAIDVQRSRRGGVRPLPLRAEGVGLVSDGPTRPEVPGQAPSLAVPEAAQPLTVVEAPATRIERWKPAHAAHEAPL